MKTKLFVGNLNFDTKDDELRKLFETYGPIETVTIVTDKRSGRSKGYGFVQMVESKDAARALELSGREFMGRDIVVTEADSPGEGQTRRNSRPRGRHFNKGNHRHGSNSHNKSMSKRDIENQKQGWWSRLLKVFGGGGDSAQNQQQRQSSHSGHPQQRGPHSGHHQGGGRRRFRKRPRRPHDLSQ